MFLMEITLNKIFDEPPVLNNWTEDQLTELVRNLVTQLELTFWLNGKYLEQKDLEQKFNVTGDLLLVLEDRINETLVLKRDLPRVKFKNSKFQKASVEEPDLDPYFVVACSLICDSLDKRSKAAKLKAIGLSTKKFNNLLENKAHSDYFKSRVEKTFKGATESAKLSLTRNVEAGDLQSIKFFMELTGQHDPNREVTVNLQKLILLFMEILVRHVDQRTVQLITQEFDTKILEVGGSL